MANFLVNRFHGHFARHHARHVVLQRGAKNSAGHNNDEQRHQNRRQAVSVAKSGVKHDQRQTQQAEPQMPAHPGLRASDSPDRNFFARTQQRGKDHERESNDCRTPGPAPCRPSSRAADAGTANRYAIEQRAETPRIASDAISQLLCVWSIRTRIRSLVRHRSNRHSCSSPASRSHSLPQCFRKEVARLHAMRRVVRTGVDAAGFRLVGAQVAGGRLFLDHGFLLARMLRDRPACAVKECMLIFP